MQNFPNGQSPFIMQVNKYTDCRVTFGKTLSNSTVTLQPSLVALAQLTPGHHHQHAATAAAAANHQLTENTVKQYTPYTNQNEIWKVLNMNIGEHNMSNYEISNQGRIRRGLDQSVLPLFICNETGLVCCDLGTTRSYRRMMIDALVCQTFCMDTLREEQVSPQNVVVHHMDGNRLNNHATNLAFMSNEKHSKETQDHLPHDHTVVLDGRLYHHFGARLSYIVSRETTRRC